METQWVPIKLNLFKSMLPFFLRQHTPTINCYRVYINSTLLLSHGCPFFKENPYS